MKQKNSGALCQPSHTMVFKTEKNTLKMLKDFLYQNHWNKLLICGWMDESLHPDDVEFTSASRFYESVHGHWNVFKLAIFEQNTTVGRTALKSETEKEGLSEWAPSKNINGNSPETEETHTDFSSCWLQQRQFLPTLAHFTPKAGSHCSWLGHTARTFLPNVTPDVRTSAFLFLKGMLDTRALGGDYYDSNRKRLDWALQLPIQHHALKMESPAMHTCEPFVGGTLPSFSLVCTKTSSSSACPTSREAALTASHA